MNLTYNEAYRQLTELVAQLEDDKIQLDTLAEKVKEARELITYCEHRLRGFDDDIKMILPAANQ